MVQARQRANKKTEGAEVSWRIVAMARKHFLTHGFRRCTMDDLAQELGMSKKTVYACFPSKAALLRAVIHNKFNDVEAGLKALQTPEPPDFMASLQQLLAYIQHVAEEIRPPFIRDLERDDPEFFALVESRRRELIHRHFKTLFDDGRKAGIIRADIPVTLMIEILLGATEAIVNPKKMLDLGLVPNTGMSAVLKIVLEGVITRHGRRA